MWYYFDLSGEFFGYILSSILGIKIFEKLGPFLSLLLLILFLIIFLLVIFFIFKLQGKEIGFKYLKIFLSLIIIGFIVSYSYTTINDKKEEQEITLTKTKNTPTEGDHFVYVVYLNTNLNTFDDSSDIHFNCYVNDNLKEAVFVSSNYYEKARYPFYISKYDKGPVTFCIKKVTNGVEEQKGLTFTIKNQKVPVILKYQNGKFVEVNNPQQIKHDDYTNIGILARENMK